MAPAQPQPRGPAEGGPLVLDREQASCSKPDMRNFLWKKSLPRATRLHCLHAVCVHGKIGVQA